MQNKYRLLLPLGMVAALVYAGMVLLGQALNPGMDPVRSFISYLTADGAPHSPLLRAMNNLHGLLLLLFAIGVNRAVGACNRMARAGYRLLLIMSAAAFIGYALFPLRANESFWSPRNITHFVMSVALIATTIITAFMIGAGHLRERDRIGLGRFSVCSAACIALFGAITLACMFMMQSYMGLVQRLMVFSMEGWVFGLSLAHTISEYRHTSEGR